MTEQSTIDEQNRRFWNEACGTMFANELGAAGDDKSSIAKFDNAFFSFYPYLDHFIKFNDLAGKDVLEVGLGYGSVSQRLAASGAKFQGLDIADGPVNWVNHRLALHGLPGGARQGSILQAPFADESFDAVVTIGCLHHTGDFRKAVSEVRRVLRPGGRAVIMVYNATNYFRWMKNTGETIRYGLASLGGTETLMRLDAQGRARFDTNTAGEAAPETVLQTKSVLNRILSKEFREVEITRKNASDHQWRRWIIPRVKTMPILGPLFGLDLYATALK